MRRKEEIFDQTLNSGSRRKKKEIWNQEYPPGKKREVLEGFVFQNDACIIFLSFIYFLMNSEGQFLCNLILKFYNSKSNNYIFYNVIGFYMPRVTEHLAFTYVNIILAWRGSEIYLLYEVSEYLDQ